jgi:hypothetical protein
VLGRASGRGVVLGRASGRGIVSGRAFGRGIVSGRGIAAAWIVGAMACGAMLGGTVASAGASTVAAATLPPVPARCDALRGRDLVASSSPGIRVVAQPGPTGDRILGCVLPRGPVRVLGGASSGPQGVGAKRVGPVAGDWVEVATQHPSRDGNFYRQDELYDLATGAHHAILAADLATVLFYPSVQVLTGDGRLAAVFTRTRGEVESEIVGFEPDGTRRVLDGPAPGVSDETLTLLARVVTWVDDGVTRTAQL